MLCMDNELGDRSTLSAVCRGGQLYYYPNAYRMIIQRNFGGRPTHRWKFDTTLYLTRRGCGQYSVGTDLERHLEVITS